MVIRPLSSAIFATIVECYSQCRRWNRYHKTRLRISIRPSAKGYPICPGELRHVREVHAVYAGDDRQRNGDGAVGGDLANELVQLVRHPGLQKVEYFLEVISFEIGGILQVAVLLAEHRQAPRVDGHDRFVVDGERVDETVVELIRLRSVDADRLQVVAQLGQVLQNSLGGDRVAGHDPSFKIRHAPCT